MAITHTQLTPQLVQAVRDTVDILAIASEHTRLRKAGRRHTGLCPLHKEKTPSFSVDPDQGLFYCFGCGAGGDSIKLHMLLSGDDFPAAIESLARRYGIPMPVAPARRGPGGGGAVERDLEAVLEAAQAFFASELERSPVARRYLETRRIDRALGERFGLGYAPDDWRRLVGELHPRFSFADLEAAGLATRSEKGGDPYDRFRHRLMFPIRNGAGRLVGFGGRTLGDDKAKYVNTPETDRFHKGSILYGLDKAKKAIRETGRAVLVEGYFDLLAVVAAGVEGAVASMGTALTPEQARLLARHAEDVVVGYDGDDAGENASRRALALLLAEGLGVRRAGFGAGHDPDSLRLAQGEAALAARLAEAPDFVALEVDRLVPPDVQRHPRLRAKAAAAVADLLRPIRDGILRYGYGRVAADRLAVPVEMLWKRLSVDQGVIARAASGVEVERETGAGGVRLIRSTEDRTLQLLLGSAGPLARTLDLPPPEAFHDPQARNIYATWAGLYAETGRAPGVREVLGRLAEAGGAVDRLAQLLVEEEVTGKAEELAESLRHLIRRYRRQRLQDLTREIREAERRGDAARVDDLVTEKTRLSRDVHAVEAAGAGESSGSGSVSGSATRDRRH